MRVPNEPVEAVAILFEINDSSDIIDLVIELRVFALEYIELAFIN